VWNALELLVADRPLVVAVDDVQWLDAETVGALAFALRRLEAPVSFLLARRLGADGGTELERAFEGGALERQRVGPVSLGALQQVLHDRLDRVLSRPTLLRIHETSGGNPFYALELARALGPDVEPMQPLPVPSTLEELVSTRLARFAGPTRDALALAAAQARLTTSQLRRLGVEEQLLEPARREQVLERGGEAVRFTHPLLASVLYQGLPAAERRSVHRRLAEVVDEPLARARHLALSADEPDREIAATLERATATARAQGAPIAAAELGEHAVRLTPPDEREDAGRRARFAARAHLAAGEVERARVLARDLLDRATPGPERAEALVLLAEADREEPRLLVPRLEEALREPGAPLALQAEAHQRLSLFSRFTQGLAVAERHAQAAVALSERAGDAPLRAAALAGLALIRLNAGEPGALPLAEQACALAEEAGETTSPADAAFSLAHVLVWSCLHEQARELLERMERDWRERDERVAAYVFWYLALVELRTGRLARAGELADRSRELSLPYGREEAESPTSLYPHALVALYTGELERARELALEMSRLAELHMARLSAPAGTLGTAELWSGDAAAAVACFAEAERTTQAADLAEPSKYWWRAEQVEALLEVGRPEDAVACLDAWEADGLRLGRDWVLAHATRCRGLVAAAGGEVEHALALLGEAALRHDAAGDPFGRARALLALGVARRRARQKRDARETIEAARAAFQELGAAGWEERAGRELGTIGGRTRSEDLTAAERRVADLVAQGRTNAEVAAALFLAERTVASHLTRVYAKLGVRSRTELVRKHG
jgi:DNA-binding CsgD family transcriptional regulator